MQFVATCQLSSLAFVWQLMWMLTVAVGVLKLEACRMASQRGPRGPPTWESAVWMLPSRCFYTLAGRYTVLCYTATQS